MAGSAVGGEVVLPCLDVVLGLAAGAVEPLVKVLGPAAFEVGDDKAGVGALGPRFDAGDDALNPAPARGGIVVDIEHDALGPGTEGAAVLVDQSPAEAQQRPPIGQIF